MSGVQGSRGGSQENVNLQAQLEAAKDEAAEIRAERHTSKQGFVDSMQRGAIVNRAKLPRKSTKAKPSKRIQKMMQGGDKLGRVPVQEVDRTAEKFQQKNPELKANILKQLLMSLDPQASADELLEKIHEFYPDEFLTDEALDFLIETTTGELKKKLKEAKAKHRAKFEREIKAGQNISEEARLASAKGIGTPTDLRVMYRDITGNPRDANTLFMELSGRYAYKELWSVVKFLLHSMGSDLKSKGPSIERGLLHNIMTEVKALQAVLGVYHFFKSRMPLVRKMMDNEGLEVPKELNFESLSKHFVKLVAERYPTSDKVLAQAAPLGIEAWLTAKIIAFTQYRDAVRQVSAGRMYRSIEHRDQLLTAIIEALEELEDALEETLDDEEDEDETTE